jgi:hypothetical protein
MRPGNRACCARRPVPVPRASVEDCRHRPETAAKESWWCRAEWSGSPRRFPHRRRRGSNRARDRPRRARWRWSRAAQSRIARPYRRRSTPSSRILLASESPPRTNSDVCAPSWPVLHHKRARHQPQRAHQVVAQRQIERPQARWWRRWSAAAAWAFRSRSPRSTRAPTPAQHHVALDVVQPAGVEARRLQLPEALGRDHQEEPALVPVRI